MNTKLLLFIFLFVLGMVYELSGGYERIFVESLNTNFWPTEFDLQDCIFDQATQTDDFLNGVVEFEGYVWNPITKTAEIPTDGLWQLTIKRGGCDHFELSANFKRKGLVYFEDEKDFVYQNVMWITVLLEEFDGESIKKTIANDKVSITKETPTFTYMNFMDEKIYESYFMYFEQKNDSTQFNISYSLN